MSYTLIQATTKVRELLNEEVASFWTDTEIQGWLAEAAIDISSKLLCVTASDTITLATNQYKYVSSDEAWIATCLKPKAVWYDLSASSIRSLQIIEPQYFGHMDQVGSVPKYVLYDSMLRAFFFNPTPAATENDKTVQVIYSVESDDITAIPDEYQPLAFLYATAKGKLKERLFADATYYMQEYRGSINFEKQDKYSLGTQPDSDFILPNQPPQSNRR